MNISQLFVHSVDGEAGCFLIWTTVNNPMIKKSLITLAFFAEIFIPLGVCNWNGIAG